MLRTLGEEPRFRAAEPGRLEHHCSSLEAVVSFWPGSLCWRTAGADASELEEALSDPGALRAWQPRRPGQRSQVKLVKAPLAGEVFVVSHTAQTVQQQPTPQPQPPQPRACSESEAACSSAIGRQTHAGVEDRATATDDLRSMAARRRSSSELPGCEPPPLRRRRLTGKQADPAALPRCRLLDTAPCAEVPPREGSLGRDGQRRTVTTSPDSPRGVRRGSDESAPSASTLPADTGANGGRREAPLLGLCAPRRPA